MNFWLWLLTALGAGLGLLGSAISAISAVFKSASSAKGPINMLVLIASNISSAVTQVVAFVCWLIQFFQYLQHNVLAAADHKQHWYSNGLASLGYSFYMVMVSTLVVLINISILMYARHCERKDRQRFETPSEEKNQCAIMLYWKKITQQKQWDVLLFISPYIHILLIILLTTQCTLYHSPKRKKRNKEIQKNMPSVCLLYRYRLILRISYYSKPWNHYKPRDLVLTTYLLSYTMFYLSPLKYFFPTLHLERYFISWTCKKSHVFYLSL